MARLGNMRKCDGSEEASRTPCFISSHRYSVEKGEIEAKRLERIGDEGLFRVRLARDGAGESNIWAWKQPRLLPSSVAGPQTNRKSTRGSFKAFYQTGGIWPW